MRTFETDKTVVDIIAWPKDRVWEERYHTASTIDGDRCRLVLSNEVFSNEAKANSSYKRFSNMMLKEGLNPPNVIFRNMSSNASKDIFCILTTTESVFNSACEVGKIYLIESGTGEKKKICAIRFREERNSEEEVVG